MGTRLAAVVSSLVGLCRRSSRYVVLLALLWSGLAGMALGAPDDPREDRILQYLAQRRAEFEAMEAPDAEAVRAYVDRIQLAADVARSVRCDTAEAEAMLVVGGTYEKHGQPKLAESAYRRALASARRGGEWQLEAHALEGILQLLLRSGGEEDHDPLGDALVAYLDVSTVNDRLLDALDWYEGVRKDSGVPVRVRDRYLVFTVLRALDYLAEARIKGEAKDVPVRLRECDAVGLYLLAGKIAEEFQDIHGLETALSRHRERGDAAAEARVGSLLLKVRPAGDGSDDLRARTFDAAVRSRNHGLAAELAPDEELAAAYRALSTPRPTPEDEAAPDPTDWQRDGRWPDDADRFLEAIVKGMGPNGDWEAKPDLLEFACADGSRAYVPLFLDLLKTGGPPLREAAAFALDELATARDLPALRAALSSENWDVRRQIAITLGRFAEQDPSIIDVLEARLGEERNGDVLAALRWALVRAGKSEYLDDLKRQRNRSEVADVALFDLGFVTAAPVLERNSAPGLTSPAAEETALLLGYTDNPASVYFLERYARNGERSARLNAARSLSRFDTPRARAFRKARLQPVPERFSPEWVWWGLRDMRRGRWDGDEMMDLIDAGGTAFGKGRFLEAEALRWLTGERTGHVDFAMDVGNDRVDGPTRRALRGLKGRRTDLDWSQQGSGTKKEVELVYEGQLAAAALHVELRPTALLLDPGHLVVNLRSRQRLSSMARKTEQKGSWTVELQLEASDVFKGAHLEGVGGLADPLAGSGKNTLSFSIPEGVTTEALRLATLVLRFKFFNREKTLRFRLAPILHVGDEIRPDLVPENLSVVPPTPRPSTHCLVLFDVVNGGHANAPRSTAVVYVRNKLKPDGRREIGRIHVPALGEGERVELTLGTQISAEHYLAGYTPGWIPEDPDTAIEVVLDADRQVEETDEHNNRGIRPVALVLDDEEKAAQSQAEVLARLDQLSKEIEGFGPEAEPEALREALDQMLEHLGAIRPRTPAIERARKLLQMLAAQMEARDRLRKAIPKILEFDPTTGSDEEAEELLGQLLRAQVDLLRSGIPVSAKQIAGIQENLDAYRETFGAEREALDARQREALRNAQQEIRIGRGTQEILGSTYLSPEMDPSGGFGPEVDPEKRRAAEAFLRRNCDWNAEGIELAHSTFQQAIGGKDRWFEPSDMETIRARWEAWSKPPEETAKQVESNAQDIGSGPGGAAVEKSSRNLLKRLGF